MVRTCAFVCVLAGFALGADAAAQTVPKRARSTQVSQRSLVRLFTVDGEGVARPAAQSQVSFQRLPPAAIPSGPQQPHADPDALRYLLAAPIELLPSVVSVRSLDAGGVVLDSISGMPLETLPCPTALGLGRGVVCAATAPIRVVGDAVDRNHPLTQFRSIRGALAGVLNISAEGPIFGQLRIMGPRTVSLGPVAVLTGKLRFVFVRMTTAGPAPIGVSALGQSQAVQSAAAQATQLTNELWAACGIGFGAPAQVSQVLVDPPSAGLLEIGCGLGLPSAGGRLRFRVGQHNIGMQLPVGLTPRAMARFVAAHLREKGLTPQISDNPRVKARAHASSDIMVHDDSGTLLSSWLTISPPRRGAINTDSRMSVCLGHVDLSDGLDHFRNGDASSGTLEERTLLKALDDHDPSTIDVIVVPAFAGGGRLGESFIHGDGGPLRNTIVLDRTGFRARREAFTLPHELGHVLLDDPSHSDDFGVDTPSRLMDANAADPSAFGPRRLLLRECERAILQSGPTAPMPLLIR